MTVITDRPAVTPRSLITPALFSRLTARIAIDHPEHAHQADVIMEQALAFLAACAVRPTARLAPSEIVDIGWHTFILYTREYAEFCQETAGRFIHHNPTDDNQAEGGCTAADTVAVIRGLGLPVVADLWGHAADCEGSGTGKCSQCHQGCTNSPTK
ncbi:hypothetical protein GCM10022252_44310 [Streptosporangium oxazolinicum]|uniref:Uncharacterized protein n=1 Tax=Streptosporangium oxazolinicum TaxID=909287 RepID=A0ABP8B2P4_9ACTN